MKIKLLAYYLKRFSWLLYAPFAYKDRINEPVFLLGNQGGGLTFVSRIIRRNKSMFTVSGNYKYWTGADEMCTVYELLLSKNLRLAGRILKTDPKHEIFTQPRSWSYGSDDLIDKYHLTEEDVKHEDVNSFKKALNIAAFRFGKKDKRFVDKSQIYTLKSRFIQQILEGKNPYFVLITRNPYVACYRAASGKAGDMQRYSSFLGFEERLEICVQHWKNCIERIEEDSKYLKNFKHYKFEDFLNEPEKYTKDLCDFLKLPFDEDMLPAPNQKVPFATKYESRWYPVRNDVNSKYLKEISSKHINYMHSELGEIAHRFGYTKLKSNENT